MPASSSASSSTRPAGPTNGRPCLSSWSPGCSPTNITPAPAAPSPKTVCVPVCQSGHALQSAASARSSSSVMPRRFPRLGEVTPSWCRNPWSRMVVRPATPLRVMPGDAVVPSEHELVESYRRLADVFHEVLAEQSLDALLVRIADALGDLIPHDTLSIYEADEPQQVLLPVLVRDPYADEILRTQIGFDEGITGWAARRREPVLT